MKILKVRWRTGYWSMGFILFEDEIGELIVYMGMAEGKDEEADIIKISQHGMKMSKIEAVGFFPEYADLIKDKYRLKSVTNMW